MSDKPINDRIGNIFFFKLEGNNSPIIVSNNVGTIDYEKGEIMLKPINITGTSKKVQDISIIEVSACPKSNDVIGLQDLYLQLDVNNSTVDMVTDGISSGENSSYVGGGVARLTESESLNTSLTSSDTYILGSSTTLTY